MLAGMAILSNSLPELLVRALMVGAQEVRLIPGRRTIVVLPEGESEVRGEAQTAEHIDALIAPLMTQSARRALSSGWAEWDFELEERGPVRACAEVKMGLVHVSLFLDRCETPAAASPVGRAPKAQPAPVAIRPGPPEAAVPEPALPRPAPLPTQAPMRPEKLVYDAGLSGGSTAGIDGLLVTMLERKASDLHVSTGVPPMLRVDGEMMAISGQSPMSAEAIQKTILPIVPPRNRDEFQRTHDTDFAYELGGRARFRVNLFVDLHGMGAVFRVIPTKILTVDDLGLPRGLLSLCTLSKGLVLVTGPTGSGKSTTLAALVDYINRVRSAHVITIEDPIEFVHQNNKCLINQRQVGEHTDSFKRALRAALREDPDIVLLGEMRDLETVSIAIETAETGHLVFGTLHTSSAPSTIDRIIDQFPPEQQNQIRVMLSSSLRGVVCQMLCKKVGGGRVAALEIMFGLPAIANLIREQKIFQIPSIIQTGRKLGMCLMNDYLLGLTKAGTVTPEEALSKAYDRAGLVAMFQQSNIAVKNPTG
jgi:twitching motility protein PilT